MNHKGTKDTKVGGERAGVKMGRAPFDPYRVGIGDADSPIERLAFDVIGAAIELHRHIGPGLLESVYEQGMAVEFGLRGIPHQRRVPVCVLYKDHRLGEGRIDFVVGGSLVVELKAVDQLAPIHTAQALSYLRITGHRLGLLINFNVPTLKEGVRRVVL